LENQLKTGAYSSFTQQLSFIFLLNNTCSDIKWKTYHLRLDIGYRFAFHSKPIVPPRPPMPIIPDPDEVPDIPVIAKEKVIPEKIEPAKQELNVKIQNISGKVFTGSELLATLPLVNAMFFDKGSAEIPARYLTHTKELPSFFYGDAVDIHKYVLLRIADIVSKNPDARILLHGATSGKETEPDGIELAKRRADVVYQAFVSIGVPENIMKKAFSVSPEYSSTQDVEEGRSENQRVDIIVQNAPLQEYIASQKFAEFNGKTDIKVDFKNVPEGKNVILKPDFYDTSIVCKNGETYKIPVKKRIENDKDKFELHIDLNGGEQSVSDSKEVLPADFPHELIDFNISNFEAVLRFDYDQSFLSSDNKGLLKQLCSMLPEGTTIIIYGSADALGTEKRNVELENQRANVTKQFIKSQSKNKFEVITDVSKNKFSEATEEGRFLNRSIRIRLK